MKYINEYKKYLKDNNYSNSAIIAYITGLKLFNKFLNKNNIFIENLRVININNYIDLLKDSISPSTQVVYLNGVKNYLNFIKKYYNFELKFNIIDIKQIKVIKKTKKNVNIKEINNIINTIDIHKSLQSKRDHLIIQLIIKTGMRISEIVKIKKEDIIKNQTIIKDIELLKLIKSFINEINTNSEYLLTALSPRVKNKGDHLTTRNVERMIRVNFNNYSYNDLKSVYYKSLINNLPNITKIFKHNTIIRKIKLQEINNII